MKAFYYPLLFALAINSIAHAQENSILEVHSFQLDNGLTVFLNEDKTANKVFGAVMVNAGAKHESPDATGMAHYLEHLLFKGTNVLGTADFEKEKPHLDSINTLYEKLALTEVESEQLELQRLINEQAIEASQYGLPTEFDKLLRSIGGTSINAFTNYEMTFYHNSFPSHEIERWMDLYATRFQNPVFRSFQSELEVVYEEKNRAMDDFNRRMQEKMSSIVLPNLPYGQWSVLGKIEHLKKPSLIKMYDFFNTHYVAGNMALILTGNFESEAIKPLIEEKFGKLPKGEAPELDLPDLQPLTGKELEKIRMTPVKAGIMGWQTVAETHPDRVAMDVCEFILYNNSETGLINKIQLNNEMLYTGAISSSVNDAGAFYVFHVPKILIQSIKKTKGILNQALDDVKEGNFSDEMLKSAKFELSNFFQRDLESLSSRGIMIGKAFNMEENWKDFISYPEKVNQISKEEVMRVARTYLNDKSAEVISRTGFGKAPKLDKPPYKPVVAKQDTLSAYAQAFAEIPAQEFKPRFLDFEKDVQRMKLKGGHEIIATQNPINNIFTLYLRFKTGRLRNPDVRTAADLMNYLGAGEYSLEELKQAYASLGCNYNVYSSDNYTTISLNGNESSLPEALELTNVLIHKPKASNRGIELLYNELKTQYKSEKKTYSLLGTVMLNYAVFGENSPYLARIPSSEVKSASAEKLVNTFTDATQNYQCEVIFIGKTAVAELGEMIENKLGLAEKAKTNEFSLRQRKKFNKSQIIFVDNKKTVQSQIYFYIPGEKNRLEDHDKVTAFNEYFGGGFSGLVTQEIREYRSLAYATGANYTVAPLKNNKGEFFAFVGAQADKTQEAVRVMHKLISNMPQKPERIPLLSKSLQAKVQTSFPEFRDIPYDVISYRRQGYDVDPNTESFDEYQNMKMEDIVAFYEKYVKGKPFVITIYGDKKRVNPEALKDIAEVKEMKIEDMIAF